MGLIHALKYQISTPPTVEEVLALPPDIILDWIGKDFTSAASVQNTINHMHSWYKSECEQTRGGVILFTEDLRRLIRDYKE
jgi:hypothetical protein